MQPKLGTQRRLLGVRVCGQLLCIRRGRQTDMLGLRDRRPRPARDYTLLDFAECSHRELRGRHVFRLWLADERVHSMLGTSLRCRHLPAGMHVYDQ